MPLTVTPLGMRCNLQCGYCYEDPLREAGNSGGRYEVAKMKVAIAAASSAQEAFLLFGGEPLLLPKDVLEELWAWGFERSGKNMIQTNGCLIDSDHIALFKKYKVGVGVSIDGPGPLNDARWDHTLARTRMSTERTEKAIGLLCENRMVPSLIVTLHRLNATGESLQVLIDWFRSLKALGVNRIGLHLLEVENEQARRKYEMTVEESVNAILRLRETRKELPGVAFTLLDDLEDLLLGKDATVKCIWKSCDPYTTHAVRGIDGQGEHTMCSRVNKEGIDFVPLKKPGYERYLALYQTPQEAGGCKDCRLFLMCRGQCPGTAMEADWRNRSEQCLTWTRIFEAIESELVAAGKTPLSLSSERKAVELFLLQLWNSGHTATATSIVQRHNRRDGKIALPSPEQSNHTREVGTFSNDPLRRVTAFPSFADRLPFDLRPFTRLAWASERARKTWGPKLTHIRQTLATAECLAVSAGIRPVALINVPDEESVHLQTQLTSQGLTWVVIDDTRDEKMRSMHATGRAESGRTALFAIARTPMLQAFLPAWTAKDHGTVSELLGYPECCRGFLIEVCVRNSFSDTIWAMAQAECGSDCSEREVKAIGNTSANILLARLGIRAVPHRPCSFRCVATENLAKQLRMLAINAKPEAIEAYLSLDEMLEWPAEWSALHGIAEIRSPIMKICGDTDATAGKYVVKWMGERYPNEGATGLAFPYRHRTRGRSLKVLNASVI